jgi:hypothetical protein
LIQRGFRVAASILALYVKHCRLALHRCYWYTPPNYMHFCLPTKTVRLEKELVHNGPLYLQIIAKNVTIHSYNITDTIHNKFYDAILLWDISTVVVYSNSRYNEARYIKGPLYTICITLLLSVLRPSYSVVGVLTNPLISLQCQRQYLIFIVSNICDFFPIRTSYEGRGNLVYDAFSLSTRLFLNTESSPSNMKGNFAKEFFIFTLSINVIFWSPVTYSCWFAVSATVVCYKWGDWENIRSSDRILTMICSAKLINILVKGKFASHHKTLILLCLYFSKFTLFHIYRTNSSTRTVTLLSGLRKGRWGVSKQYWLGGKESHVCLTAERPKIGIAV